MTVKPSEALPPCARCALVQRTCCQRAEILVTEGDVARISATIGRADFHERRAPLDPEYLEEDPEDPSWLRLTVRPDGTRRVLRRQANGDCTFLGPQGCVLELETRPLVCRLYPYAFTESGVDGREEGYCPTALLAPDGRAMVDVLDVAKSDADRWHSTLYDELHHGHA